MGNSKRAKVLGFLKGELGHDQTKTHTLSEQDRLKKFYTLSWLCGYNVITLVNLIPFKYIELFVLKLLSYTTMGI